MDILKNPILFGFFFFLQLAGFILSVFLLFFLQLVIKKLLEDWYNSWKFQVLLSYVSFPFCLKTSALYKPDVYL